MADRQTYTLAEELYALGWAIRFLREDAEKFRQDGLPATGANDDRIADRLEHLLRRLEASDVR